MVRQYLAVVVVLILVIAAAPVPGQARPRPSVLVHHVVAHDLVTMRAAAEIEIRLEHASTARADSFILELGSVGWRADVVRRVAAALRASPVRTIVWLRARAQPDAPATVGAGHAILGLIAGECWIDPETRVDRLEEHERAALAPKGTDHSKIKEELMRWAGERRAGRGFDALLPRLLIGPPGPMWGVSDTAAAPDGRLRLLPILPTPAEDGPARVIELTRRRHQSDLASFDAVAATQIGLAAGAARALPDIFRSRGVNPSAGGAIPVASDIDAIVRAAHQAIDALDRELAAIDVQLGSKPRDQRVNTGKFYRDLAGDVLKRTGSAKGHLEACEKRLVDDPELTRTPPPGESRVDNPDRHAAAWRKAFQKRRDELARLERRARAFAGK